MRIEKGDVATWRRGEGRKKPRRGVITLSVTFKRAVICLFELSSFGRVARRDFVVNVNCKDLSFICNSS